MEKDGASGAELCDGEETEEAPPIRIFSLPEVDALAAGVLTTVPHFGQNLPLSGMDVLQFGQIIVILLLNKSFIEGNECALCAEAIFPGNDIVFFALLLPFHSAGQRSGSIHSSLSSEQSCIAFHIPDRGNDKR